MKRKLTIVVLYMITSSCNNTDSNEFAFSSYSWECSEEGGREIFISDKEEWEIDQSILDGITTKEHSPEHIDKNQSLLPNKFEFDSFSFRTEGKKVTICMLENTMGKSRNIKFMCRHISAYHAITVVQLPDINITEHSGN